MYEIRPISSGTLQRNLAVVRARKKHPRARVRAARWENLRLLGRACRPGTGRLLVGLGGIGLGAWSPAKAETSRPGPLSP